MTFYTSKSIQRKVTLVILLTSCVVLLVAVGLLFSFQLITVRQSLTRDLSAISEIIANNSTAAVSFRDKTAAHEILSSLKAKPRVISAYIRLPNGVEFARFGLTNNQANLTTPLSDGPHFIGRYFLHVEPITLDGERIGTLYVQSDYWSTYQELVCLYAGIVCAVLIISMLLAFILSSRLQRLISEPILRLADTAKVIAEKKDYSVRAETSAEGELSLLTTAFNQMLDQIQVQDADLHTAHRKLEDQVAALQYEIAERKRAEERLANLHTQLVDASRKAGMAEVATGVLHNVGNVLNSINVSITIMRERMNKSRLGNIGKIASLLRENESNLGHFLTSDPKGKMIPHYLGQLSDHLTKENNESIESMESVAKNLEHIKEIVAMQQSYARMAGVLETLPPANLVEDALQLHASSLERRGIKVIRDYEEVPPVTVDKHKILQILVNLVRNAIHALEESQKPDKVLRLSVSRKNDNQFYISVADNGIGILHENRTRIFSHGFTTKKGGHGFGLHSGALAAKEMGGRLSAHSDGFGQGAVFTLELPMDKPEETAD